MISRQDKTGIHVPNAPSEAVDREARYNNDPAVPAIGDFVVVVATSRPDLDLLRVTVCFQLGRCEPIDRPGLLFRHRACVLALGILFEAKDR